MNKHTQLTKGLEEEVYTGRPDGTVVGMSAQIEADLAGYECEPDNRNAEFGTEPHRDYPSLRREMIERRIELREYLKAHDGLTLIPGGALSLGDTGVFCRSDPEKEYHGWIENAYGTDVVTASNHINVGIEDPEEIIRAFRVIRCEAALFLALTAASPFLDGKATGYQSHRWHMFPKTPERVPLFANFAEYVSFVEEQLATGVMQNGRHLWVSTRPNGGEVPYKVDRLELRVCDRMADIDLLMAVTALFEARIWQVLEEPSICPLYSSRSASEMIDLIDANEEAIARDGLEAQVTPWNTDQACSAKSWLSEWLAEIKPVADAHGLTEFIQPVYGVLDNGNTASCWLKQHAEGMSPAEIIQAAIRESEEKDLEAAQSI